MKWRQIRINWPNKKHMRKNAVKDNIIVSHIRTITCTSTHATYRTSEMAKKSRQNSIPFRECFAVYSFHEYAIYVPLGNPSLADKAGISYGDRAVTHESHSICHVSACMVIHLVYIVFVR